MISGTSPHGQGHDTTFSQIVADALGVTPDDVEVLYGDTSIATWGLDSYGSRSLSAGGVAIQKAAERVREKARVLAAHELEVAEDDLEWTDGKFQVKGAPDRAKTVPELAFSAWAAHNMPAGRRPGAGGQRRLRPAQLDLPVRDPHLRGRGRPGDRLDPDRQVRGRGRLRHHHQPDDRGRPGDGRGGPGHRRGAVRGGDLRRERHPADRQHDHLPDPVRGRAARLHPGQDRDPFQHQPDGGQGHRRDRHHRRPAGGAERGRRRAALRRGRVHRQAGLGREGLAGRPGRPGPGAARAHARGRRHRRGQYDPREEGGVA